MAISGTSGTEKIYKFKMWNFAQLIGMRAHHKMLKTWILCWPFRSQHIPEEEFAQEWEINANRLVCVVDDLSCVLGMCSQS